jgi:hypothetical protein
MADSEPSRLDAMKETVGSLVSNKWQVVVASLVAGILVAALVGGVLYFMMTRGKTSARNAYPIAGSELPLPANTVHKLRPAKGMPVNNDQITLSFWIYVQDFEKGGRGVRHVLHRGDESTSDLTKIGPHVYLDNSENKMYVVFKPKELPANAPTNATKRRKYILHRHGIALDYLPAQRWTHIAVTADTRANVLRAFVDGEEVKTVTAAQRTQYGPAASETVRLQLSNTDIVGSGDIWVGGNLSRPTGAGFSGLVCNIKFFDWALNKDEVYDQYRQGPVASTMARLGMPVYGLRSPIYPIGA